MSVKTITNFNELMRLAHLLGKARMSGNEDEIKKAQKEHDDYAKLCLEADEMRLDVSRGFL